MILHLYKRIRFLLCSQRASTLIECVVALLMFTIILTTAAFMLSTAGILSNKATELEAKVNAVIDSAEETVGSGDIPVTLQFTGVTPSKSVNLAIVQSDDVSIYKFIVP